MGVAGCGKSTVGKALARGLGVAFKDGDDFHSPSSIDKMTKGVPLADEDRASWIADIAHWLGSRPTGVIACSALKRSYRDSIRAAIPDAVFIHLTAPQNVLAPRLKARREQGHFLGPEMLPSQFAALEPLHSDEDGVVLDVSQASAEEACAAALDWLAQTG